MAVSSSRSARLSSAMTFAFPFMCLLEDVWKPSYVSATGGSTPNAGGAHPEAKPWRIHRRGHEVLEAHRTFRTAPGLRQQAPAHERRAVVERQHRRRRRR